MFAWLSRQSSVSPRIDIATNDPHGTALSSTRAQRLEMLFAAASLGVEGCPSWIIEALEANERADRKLYAEERSGPC